MTKTVPRRVWLATHKINDDIYRHIAQPYVWTNKQVQLWFSIAISQRCLQIVFSLYEQLSTKALIKVLSIVPVLKIPSTIIFSQTSLHHQTPSKAESGRQRKPYRASSSERKKQRTPVALPPDSHFNPRQQGLYIQAPRGTTAAGWGGPLNGRPCVWPLEERARRSEGQKGERERVCGPSGETDRLLMDSSTFRPSDEVLAHRVKYSWIETEHFLSCRVFLAQRNSLLSNLWS